MRFQSSMRPREAAGGVWPDTTNAGEKAYPRSSMADNPPPDPQKTTAASAAASPVGWFLKKKKKKKKYIIIFIRDEGIG